MKLVILGPQGSGKGTQASMLTEKYRLASFAMGDALRAEVAQGTPEGKEIKAILERGELVPNGITERIIRKFVEKHDKWIIDGYPRNLGQAEFFDGIASPDAVLVIEIADDAVVARLSGRRTCPNGHIYHLEHKPPKEEGVCDEDGLELTQRTDDTEAAIRKRLSIYHHETQKVIGRYADKVLRIDGDKSIEAVHEEIVSRLERLS